MHLPAPHEAANFSPYRNFLLCTAGFLPPAAVRAPRPTPQTHRANPIGEMHNKTRLNANPNASFLREIQIPLRCCGSTQTRLFIGDAGFADTASGRRASMADVRKSSRALMSRGFTASPGGCNDGGRMLERPTCYRAKGGRADWLRRF